VGEGGEGEQLFAGFGEVAGRSRQLRLEGGDDPVELGVDLDRVGLVEDGGDHGCHPPLRGLRDLGEQVT
jgi:hypothetical protein